MAILVEAIPQSFWNLRDVSRSNLSWSDRIHVRPGSRYLIDIQISPNHAESQDRPYRNDPDPTRLVQLSEFDKLG